MAAIVFALNHFEVYLLGHKITVFTDHQVIYSEYGKTLFKELKVICDIARENIQHAQSS